MYFHGILLAGSLASQRSYRHLGQPHLYNQYSMSNGAELWLEAKNIPRLGGF